MIHFAASGLFANEGKKAIAFLTKERGLSTATIRRHRLGWLPAKNNMGSKLLIPCYTSNGQLFRIRFRNDGFQDARYRISRGSNPHLPFPLGISLGKPVIIVESELDAILVFQEVGTSIGVLGMGSVGIKFSGTMVEFLKEKIPTILICLDNDKAGQERSLYLQQQLPNNVVCSVPEQYGKDPGEAWKHFNFKDWIQTCLGGKRSPLKRKP